MRLVLAASVAIYLTGCATSSAPGAFEPGASPAGARATLKTPAVIAVDYDTDRLLYWPMSKRGRATPTYLSRRLHIKADAMVADGDIVTIASYDPAELLSYDVTTKATSTVPDPYGQPIDVAIGKTGTFYALDENNVAVFPPGSPSYELSCGYISAGTAIAVDNEGDVFVDGYGRHNPKGVVEYLAGSSECVKLPLKVKQQGSRVGLGIDPKTDNLIVEDYVGCAGGDEGRITVYERPYGPKVVAQHFLHASCPGLFRLDATSTRMLIVDTFSGVRAARVHACGILWVDQRSYPKARGRSTYAGGCARAVTTIPNTLPN